MSAPKLYTAADALGSLPPVTWVVDGLLPEASTSVVFGQPGSKKTWSCLDLAVCVALGKPWFDTLATTQGAVLLVDEESGPRRLLRRLGAVIRGHLGNAGVPIFATSLHGFNFFQPVAGATVADLKNLILQTQARLVVIDALADVMLGGDENAVKDAQKVFHALRQVAESTGAAILVIHHSTKANGGYRGSTAIAGAVDLLLEVTSKQGEANVTFETAKARDSEPQKHAAVGHWTPTEFWLSAGSTVASSGAKPYTKAQRAVLSFLLGQPGSRGTNAEIGTATQYTSPVVRKAVAELCREGILKRVDGGQPGTAGTYEVDAMGLATRPL